MSRKRRRKNVIPDMPNNRLETEKPETSRLIKPRSHRNGLQSDPQRENTSTLKPPSELQKTTKNAVKHQTKTSIDNSSPILPISVLSDLVNFDLPSQPLQSQHLALDLDLTLSGVARIFAEHLKDRVAYIPSLGWHAHKGRVFEKAEPQVLLAIVEKVIREVMKLKTQTHFRPKELLEAEKLLTPSKMKQILELAKGRLTSPLGVFDSETGILNTPSGIVQTDGAIIPHQSEYRCRKITNVSYVDHSNCPTYRRILDIAFNGDENEINRFLLTIGLATFGKCPKRLILMHGGNATIKQMIRPLQNTLGSYARSCSMREAIIIQPKVNIASYCGTRLVECTTDMGSRITDEELFSYLFKGETLIERKEGSLSLQPNHVIIADESLIRPSIQHMEIEGVEEFIEVFQVSAGNIMDVKWGSMASPDEQAGIMKLLVESVRSSSNDAQLKDIGTSDRTKRYIERLVDGHPKKFMNQRTTATKHNVSFSELYSCYSRYCTEQAADAWSQKAFSSELRDLGYYTRKVKGHVEVEGIHILKGS